MTTHHVLTYLRHNRLLSETLLNMLQILIQPYDNKGERRDRAWCDATLNVLKLGWDTRTLDAETAKTSIAAE